MKKSLKILTLLSFILVPNLNSQFMIGTTEVDTTSVLMEGSSNNSTCRVVCLPRPNFPETSYVYLVYNYFEDNRIKERLVRYDYTGTELVSEEILMDDIGGSGNHNGSRLEFGPDGKLYMTTGDAVNASLAQDPEKVEQWNQQKGIYGKLKNDRFKQELTVLVARHPECITR